MDIPKIRRLASLFGFRLHFVLLLSALPLLGADGLAQGGPDDPTCWAFYKTWVDRALSLEEVESGLRTVLGYRRTLAHTVVFQVEGHTYRADQLLGTGMNQVWRGEDESGNFVVMKKLLVQESGRDQQYENLVTEYYLRNGIPVPKVIGWDKEQNVMIKAYYEGVTRDELEYHSGLLVGSKKALSQALEALKAEKERIDEIHKGFREWLKVAHPELSPEYVKRMQWVLDHADTKDENFIYLPLQRRWVMIDS